MRTPRICSIVALLSALVPPTGIAQESVVMVERFVPHISTVPANTGDRVSLYLREKLTETTKRQIEQGQPPTGRVVLMVHGGVVSSIPLYDLDYKDYSWMRHLAEEGFDTFAMDQTGYGRSPRPMMDDPCNIEPAGQAIVMQNPLPAPCDPHYSFGLTTAQSDWDEIDTVVNYLRALRGVDRVSLVSYSTFGARRAGGYAAQYPAKVDKLILFAAGYDPTEPSMPPADVPQPGVPMELQTRETWTLGRWEASVACENQVDPGIREAIWQSIISFDEFGLVWGPPEGVMRVPAGYSRWGWNKEAAARIKAPTLVIIGEQDYPEYRGRLYPDLTGIDNKVLLTMACATHFAAWETSQYKFLHEASREWLTTGMFRGDRQGRYAVGTNPGASSGR